VGERMRRGPGGDLFTRDQAIDRPGERLIDLIGFVRREAAHRELQVEVLFQAQRLFRRGQLVELGAPVLRACEIREVLSIVLAAAAIATGGPW